MGPGVSKLKHLLVKQQDEDTDDQRARLCRKRRGTGCADGTASGETKRHGQANCTRASYLFGFGFYAQAPTKSPVMPKLDADDAQATRRLVLTTRKLISPQRHR